MRPATARVRRPRAAEREAELATRLAQCEADLEAARREIAILTASTSWRWTAPMRALASLVRRAPPGPSPAPPEPSPPPAAALPAEAMPSPPPPWTSAETEAQRRALGLDGPPPAQEVWIGVACLQAPMPLRGLERARMALAAQAGAGRILVGGAPAPVSEGAAAPIPEGAAANGPGWSGIHQALMEQAFAAGATLYVALDPAILPHPDLIPALARMDAGQAGRAILAPQRWPFEGPVAADPLTLDLPVPDPACFAVPRAVFLAAGGFSPGDGPDADLWADRAAALADLCRRARDRGFSVRAAPLAHFAGELPGTPAEGEAGIDVVVRFHDMRRRDELERAVFSLAAQTHRPLRILLALQRLSETERAALREALAPLLAGSGVELELLDYAAPAPADARSELVNLGFAAARGRYLALLDHDDVLHPHAYAALVAQLRRGGAAIAFARTPLLKVDTRGAFPEVRARTQPFSGTGLDALFVTNFCPIHSFVLDRSRIPPGLLRFEPALQIEEDYEFLLRLCAAVPADFDRLDTEVGLYVQRLDGGNTLPIGGTMPPETADRADLAYQFVELRRQMTVLAPVVQAAMGVAPPRPDLTIRDWLDERFPEP